MSARKPSKRERPLHKCRVCPATFRTDEGGADDLCPRCYSAERNGRPARARPLRPTGPTRPLKTLAADGDVAAFEQAAKRRRLLPAELLRDVVADFLERERQAEGRA